MNSLWTKTVEMPHFPKLEGMIQTDVLIIGGGMAGILCAYRLQQAGVNYVLAEAETICSGITKNTTAKITSQHGMMYQKLIKKMGVEHAGMYLEANEKALAEYRNLCRNIDCDFESQNAWVYSLQDRRKCENEMAALEQIGFAADFAEEIPLPFSVAGAICFPDQAAFHPLKFVAAIVPGLHIYENTKITELAPHLAKTETGEIRANKIIIATHFPILNKHGSYFLKMYQHRSYVIELENAPNVQGMYVDEAPKGMSFRNYKDCLLIGGGAHRTGKQGGNWQELKNFANMNYPQAKEICRWATQDCMTLDHVPYIGAYSASTQDLYVATGFNKWGMTSSMSAAQLLTDLVMEKENFYAEVFSPSRSMLTPQLGVNVWEALTNILTFSTKRCPHMGCALKWNPQERTWDCPCHGSRFTENGKLIDNPSTGDWEKAM